MSRQHWFQNITLSTWQICCKYAKTNRQTNKQKKEPESFLKNHLPVKKFPHFCRTQRLTASCTTDNRWILSWTWWMQLTFSHYTCLACTAKAPSLPHIRVGHSHGSFSSDFLTKMLYTFLSDHMTSFQRTVFFRADQYHHRRGVKMKGMIRMNTETISQNFCCLHTVK